MQPVLNPLHYPLTYPALHPFLYNDVTGDSVESLAEVRINYNLLLSPCTPSQSFHRRRQHLVRHGFSSMSSPFWRVRVIISWAQVIPHQSASEPERGPTHISLTGVYVATGV